MKLSYIYLVENKNKILANGCIFEDGKICIQWKGENRSVVIWDYINDFMEISCKDGLNREVIISEDQVTKNIEEYEFCECCVIQIQTETGLVAIDLTTELD